MGTVLYPIINGNRMDFSSIRLLGLARPIIGIKAVNYKDSLKPGLVYGTSAQPVGRTRGKYEPSGDLEIFREDWGDLVASLIGLQTTSLPAGSPSNAPGTVQGFMEVSFDLIVNYAEQPASPMQTDTLIGCRIQEVDTSNSQGTDALTLKLTLSIMKILRNGFDPLNVPLTPAG